MKKSFLILILSLSLSFHLRAQEVIDQAANAAIRAEASSNTQVMHTIHVLAGSGSGTLVVLHRFRPAILSESHRPAFDWKY